HPGDVPGEGPHRPGAARTRRQGPGGGRGRRGGRGGGPAAGGSRDGGGGPGGARAGVVTAVGVLHPGTAAAGRMPSRAYTGRACRRSRDNCVANASPPSRTTTP